MKRHNGPPLQTTVPWIVIAILAVATSAQAQKQFRWKFAEGDGYRVKVVQDVTQTVAIGNQTIEIPAKITMSLTWQVASVEDDGTADISQTVDQVTMNLTIPGVSKDVKYDSSSKDEPTAVLAPIAEVIQPLIGVEFRQQMDTSGRVLKVTVPDGAFKGLESDPTLKQFFSGESFKQTIAKASPVFPVEAIEKGHTWKNKATQKSPLGSVTFDSAYTYDGEQKRNDKALDKFSVALTMAIEANGNSRGTKVEITKQDTKGTMWFDQSEGFLTESTLRQSISMKVTSGDTVVDQTVTNVMTMTVVKD